MKRLLQVRTNIYYVKKTKEKETLPDEFEKHYELVMLLDKPAYSYSNSQEIIREREIEEVRMVISENAFAGFIDILTKLKDSKESELR